jgi:hypothetical protein
VHAVNESEVIARIAQINNTLLEIFCPRKISQPIDVQLYFDYFIVRLKVGRVRVFELLLTRVILYATHVSRFTFEFIGVFIPVDCVGLKEFEEVARFRHVDYELTICQ